MLHAAAANGHAHIVTALLEAGADVLCTDVRVDIFFVLAINVCCSAAQYNVQQDSADGEEGRGFPSVGKHVG
jgi:ankyrin repeat protein